MTERGFRMNVNPVDDYAGDDIRNYITRKDCFDFCSEAFGEMRHSTEEEKMLYENMLDMLSQNIDIFEREFLAEWVKLTCEDCANLIYSRNCRWNCLDYYEDAASCERFRLKKR